MGIHSFNSPLLFAQNENFSLSHILLLFTPQNIAYTETLCDIFLFFKIYLVMSYGMRYESYPGYWVYTGDYQSFTPETDSVGNQIRHYLKAPTLEEIPNPQ